MNKVWRTFQLVFYFSEVNNHALAVGISNNQINLKIANRNNKTLFKSMSKMEELSKNNILEDETMLSHYSEGKKVVKL